MKKNTLTILRIQRRGFSLLRVACFIIFLAVGLCHAQENRGTGNKNCLWSVKSNNNTVYLLGSIHFLKAENYPLNEALEKAFYDSQVLVLETDIEAMSLPSTQKMVLEKAVFLNGKTLKESISKETYKLAKMKSAALGLNIESLNQFKPWFCALTFVTMKLQSLGFEPGYGVDNFFFKEAKVSNKEVITFETIEFQLDLFANMSLEMQGLMLLQTLKDLELVEDEFSKILAFWNAGDVENLEGVLFKSFKEYPLIYENIISKRNNNWLPKIESFQNKNKNYLVIVGAAHLIGKDGIVNLLKKKGHAVDQL